MKANGKYLLVNKINEQAVLKSGLSLTDTDMSELRYQRAKIVAKGNLVDDHLSEGDEVYYDKVHSHDTVFDGQRYTVISEHHIVAVV